ncbi:hypothetical protein [Pseudomonas sp. LRF_L74]|uniref:hypothetical protein n=1 Tax=Pseudomonas sp. LRF_L74 TaxID=3369422 RepID=UPI003F5F475D
MSTNWSDLIGSPRLFELMPEDSESRKKAHEASTHYIAQLAMGVSGIGNLMACTASNTETGVCEDSIEKVGWMLIAVGDLMIRLSDIAEASSP